MNKLHSKFPTFVLKIELGNAAMNDHVDVANALKKVAIKVGTGHDYGKIVDYNGNTVGEFEFR